MKYGMLTVIETKKKPGIGEVYICILSIFLMVGVHSRKNSLNYITSPERSPDDHEPDS